MTEPATNAEIEDVLSSIRRLVGENARDEQRADSDPKLGSEPEDMAATDATDSENSSKNSKDQPDISEEGQGAAMLVLTPAQRVEDVRHAEPVDSHEQETDARETDSVINLGAYAEPEPQSDTADTVEDAHADDQESARADAGIDQDKLTEAVVIEAVAEVVAQEIAAESVTETLEDRSEADQNGDQGADEVAMPDPSERLSDWVDGPPETPVAEETPDMSEHTAADVAVDQADQQDQAGDQSLASRIAELEAVVAGNADQWEPDGEVGSDNAAEAAPAIEWEDHVDADAAPESQHNEQRIEDPVSDDETAEEPTQEQSSGPEPGPDSAPEAAVEDISDWDDETAPDLGLLDGDPAVLDEDTLREMVAEIVRQELQGSLGERITRNVRKLVRREIHRALTAQEFD